MSACGKWCLQNRGFNSEAKMRRRKPKEKKSNNHKCGKKRSWTITELELPPRFLSSCSCRRDTAASWQGNWALGRITSPGCFLPLSWEGRDGLPPSLLIMLLSEGTYSSGNSQGKRFSLLPALENKQILWPGFTWLRDKSPFTFNLQGVSSFGSLLLGNNCWVYEQFTEEPSVIRARL